ncbi:MAG: DUF4331 family protein [Sphingobacteriales bacterium]|nr:DUF4331 family protein [Sphingobacteriales bacterium]
MIRFNKISLSLIAALSLFAASCDKNDTPTDNFDTSGTYIQNDQMARPAVNTVFVNSARKNEFNTTVPSAMNAAFNAQFQSVLTAFGYTQNALGQDKPTFAGLLVTDVLNVKMNGTTTFFDGTNVLTGRTLADDVIDTELLLIFGGPTGASNPGLTKDNVNANDKAFLNTFPYLASPF